ncbi:MAG: hypothetical protein M1832_000144 [Thelocarpon impressellum]|nr:MAG: hypothetical protein M1832_000144 [Thelocarpon impressellum]
MPVCLTCSAVYQSECMYDIDSDHRRKGALKRDIQTLRKHNGALGTIVASLRSSTDDEVSDIISHIRSDESLENLVDSLKAKGEANAAGGWRTGPQSLEGHLEDIKGTPIINASGETRYFGKTSSLGMVPTDDRSPTRSDLPNEPWTRVTGNAEFVGHLMALYFCWQHPSYVFFSKECFLYDMALARTKYCSPLLVNAVLASGCVFSDRREARQDPDDVRTAGNHFFAEAERLLNQDDRASLTHTQALAIMSIREASCGRDSSGYRLAGRCIRMALELGLHLSVAKTGIHGLTPSNVEVRKITFWGCFTLETAWSICVGRISQLPRAAIRLEKPTIVESIEAKAWKPYVDSGQPELEDFEQASHTHGFLLQLSTLSEIANDIVHIFYAPSERFTCTKLLEIYAACTRWRQTLPEPYAVTDKPTPHALFLHMYYHMVLLQLFRPFLKVELIHSPLSPRKICTKAAEDVSSLMHTHRKVYGPRRICLLIMHCLLSSSVVHMLNLPSPSAASLLVQGIHDLSNMTHGHAFAGRCLRILGSLAESWKVDLPQEAAHITADWTSPSPESTDGSLPATRSRRESPSGRRRGSATEEVLPTPGDRGDVRATGRDINMLWSPFPYEGVPHQAQPTPHPMDTSDLLDMDRDDWERFRQDGFSLGARADPVLGSVEQFDEEEVGVRAGSIGVEKGGWGW